MEQWAREWLKEQRDKGVKCLEVKMQGKNHYVYHSTSYWDKELKKPKKTSKYLGKLDPDKGLIKSGERQPSSSVTGNNGANNTCDTTSNYDDYGTTGCTYTCRPRPLGDLNGDYKITAADASIALQKAVRGEYLKDADVSGDDRITSLDALIILQRSQK